MTVHERRARRAQSQGGPPPRWVATDPLDAGHVLARWRDAEERYARNVAAFLEGSRTSLAKDDLLDLVSQRAEADAWRERFYLVSQDDVTAGA